MAVVFMAVREVSIAAVSMAVAVFMAAEATGNRTFRIS
jgi:hypothetical protein